MNPKHLAIIAELLNLPTKKVENTANLLAEGATIPFLARYRKEATGELDEVEIGNIQTQITRLTELEKRRSTILQTIGEQGKLTPELEKRINDSFNLNELEDLYLPYKPKRRTRASQAREKGLEPLAEAIFGQKYTNLTEIATPYLSEQVASVADALQGARDIIAEKVSENDKTRSQIRYDFERYAVLKSKLVKGKETEGAKYKDYFAFDEPLKKCPSHRLLAIRRGEEEGFLRVSIALPDEEALIQEIENEYLIAKNASSEQVKEAIRDAFDRLLSPSIETEFRQLAKEKADEEAVTVFADNLRQLLLAAPLGEQRVMGIDPGFRTGCKVVCLDKNGDLLHNTTVYPHLTDNQTADAARKIQHLAYEYRIEAVAIGNGTAGRETETLVRSIAFDKPTTVFMVNESGASIYSASEVAREEFPDHDITVRGAVSIGRRLLDPLAELVKIDPKSIGVGQYQHDVNQTLLKDGLDRTVESCVNSVGVNLNTASKHLLTYISGLGQTLAQNIVNYRTQNGAFKSRAELKKVTRLGEKAFEQAAGFLRIRGAKNPLDNTGVHPEAYPIVEQMASDLKVSVTELIQQKELRKQIKVEKYVTATLGLPTLKDILKEMEKLGLDPRGEAKAFSFKDGVKSMEDLHEGMTLQGIVTNITNFGAFVDIGVKQDGLVHVSQMANRFIKSPSEVVKLQQVVEVKVLEVDIPRKRVTLTMKG